MWLSDAGRCGTRGWFGDGGEAKPKQDISWIRAHVSLPHVHLPFLMLLCSLFFILSLIFFLVSDSITSNMNLLIFCFIVSILLRTVIIISSSIILTIIIIGIVIVILNMPTI